MREPERPIVCVAPHPDDETLGAGGLLAAMRMNGIPVTVVAATDGENAYDLPAGERIALGLLREDEQRKALEILGIESSMIRRFCMTDSDLSGHEPELTERLLDVAEPGMVLLAPWVGDFHPDHEACARAAASVARAKGLPLISYFFWTWHRGLPKLLDGLPLFRYNPPAKALAAKADALSMHRSQLKRADGEPILPDRLLAPARWPFEVFVTA